MPFGNDKNVVEFSIVNTGEHAMTLGGDWDNSVVLPGEEYKLRLSEFDTASLRISKANMATSPGERVKQLLGSVSV